LRRLAAEGEFVELGEGVGQSKSFTGSPKPPDPEAALFWTLIDGRNGSDYERFLCHALECIEAAFPFHDARLRQLLGPAASANNLAMLVANVLEVETVAGADAFHFTLSAKALAAAVAPHRIWVPLWAVMQATRVLLSKAVTGLRERVLGTLGGIAVSGKDRLAPRPPLPEDADSKLKEEEISAQELEEKEKAVDLFLWLKVIMRCYKEEQVNRDAAVKVMFSSVEAGNRGKERTMMATRGGADTVKSNAAPAPSGNSGIHPDSNLITASQCVAMAKSLDVNCSACLAVAVYRRAAEMGVVRPSADDMIGVPLRSVGVKPEHWITAAEEYGLLKSCLNLRGKIVTNRRAADIEGLTPRGAAQIGSLV
jgi:hypothetical protein